MAGEVLQVIENLGYSGTAYEVVKDCLQWKFGAKWREIAVYLEDLEKFRQVRLGNAKDLEQFADLFDIVIINFKS